MTLPSRISVPRLALAALAILVSSTALPAAPRPLADPPDERAIEIALRALQAVERGWALSAYDGAPRVRAAINLRGRGLGVTANAVLDRPNRRWRLDAAGDVGPLTLLVAEGTALLQVPGQSQHARGPAGALAVGQTVGRSLSAEVAAMRSRLQGGYDALAWRGEETLGGHRVHRLVEQPAPGVSATYWIDAESYLPRRIVTDRPGGGTLTMDFAYTRGPRPARIDVRVAGERDVRVVVDPAYDGQGRAKSLHLAIHSGGAPLEADVNLNWAPRLANNFFQVSPPPGSRSVPFSQLVQGVMFQSAAVLGALARVLGGG